MENKYLERQQTAAAMVDENKELAAIKGKMFLAKQFPRDADRAISNILAACQQPKLASMAIYSYPRGGQEVKGASIRLAEVVAQNWGNFLCGVKEIERYGDKALVSAYAWDLESNFQDEKIFEVPLKRTTKNGTYALTDERDIYELIANMGARRKRSTIMAVIPQFVFEIAMQQCEETLEKAMNQDGESIEDKRAAMLNAFREYGDWITEETIAGLFGKSFDAIGPKDMVRLQHLFCSIRDGFVTAEKVFGKTTPEQAAQPSAEEQNAFAAVVQKVKGSKKDAESTESADPLAAVDEG